MSDQAWLAEMKKWNDHASGLCRERDQLQARVHALEDQIEHAGCSAAHEGERTYECRIEAPCGLCRLRVRAERAEARVRELEAERDHHEARERELEARGFERPGPSAYTCGDALGLRRLPEVEPQASAPEARAPRPDCPACHGHGHYARAWVMGPDVECGCWRRLPEVEPTFPEPEVDNEELP